MSPVLNKQDMYRRLASGEFGNTTPQYFSIAEWEKSGDAGRCGFWGVRTLRPGGPCRLNCPTNEVTTTALQLGEAYNISMMVDRFATVTAYLEIWDSPLGLVVEGVEYPKTDEGWTWRNSMPDPQRRKQWMGTAARMVLRRHLNENSLSDLHTLIELYPDHVIELSALDRCIGKIPHRNAVLWEVRAY